jgi:hypothetical protein
MLIPPGARRAKYQRWATKTKGSKPISIGAPSCFTCRSKQLIGTLLDVEIRDLPYLAPAVVAKHLGIPETELRAGLTHHLTQAQLIHSRSDCR